MPFLREDETRAHQAFSHEHAPPPLETLPDADIVTPASAQFLRHNGTNWVNSAIQDADLPSTIARDSEAILKTLVDAKGDLIVGTANDTPARLGVGANNLFLKANAGQAAGMEWVGIADSDIPSMIARDSEVVLQTLADVKGDLIVASAVDTWTRLAIGTNDQVLTADSAQATGVKWAAAAGAATFVGARASKTASQSINTATETAISFDSEIFDTNGFHDNVTNNTRFTVPAGKAGKYAMFGTCSFDANATGGRYFLFRVNGTTFIAETGSSGVSSSIRESLNLVTVRDLAVGDYIEMIAAQTSGGALNITGTQPYVTNMGLYLIGT